MQPFASLIDRVGDDVPRLLINLESVGEIDEFETSSSSLFGGSYREEGFDFNGLTRGGKEYSRDAKWLGESDKGIRELAKALGWEEELEELFEAGRRDYESKEHLRTASSAPSTPAKQNKSNPAEEKAQKAEEDGSEKQNPDEEEMFKPQPTDAKADGDESEKVEKVEALQEKVKKEEQEESENIVHAKEEAEKIAKEIGEIADRPLDEVRKKDFVEEKEEDLVGLVERIEKVKLV